MPQYKECWRIAVRVGKFLDVPHAIEKAAEPPNAMRVMKVARITKDDGVVHIVAQHLQEV